MIEKPVLSIVIPVHNRPDLICRCLDSGKNQSYRPIRLIVVDNGSTDDTASRVREWAEANTDTGLTLTLIDEQKRGACAARNRGLKEVDTEFMMFFDSDDVMTVDLAMTVMDTFEKKPDLDIFYWRTAVINGKDEICPKRYAASRLMFRQIYNAFLSTQSFAVRTSYIRKCGEWNENLPGWNDWELGFRLLANNPRIKGTPRILTYIYPQNDSITGSNYHSKAGIWEKSIDAVELDASRLMSGKDAERIRRMMAYRRTVLAAAYAREGHPELATPLLRKALRCEDLTPARRRRLKLIYNYTKMGGRAAYLFW